jgi:hypothetical protein
MIASNLVDMKASWHLEPAKDVPLPAAAEVPSNKLKVN